MGGTQASLCHPNVGSSGSAGLGGGTATQYSRRVLAQRPAFVLQHLLHPVDVVQAVGIHRHQNAANVGLQESNKRLRVLGEQCPRGTPAALSLHR